MRVPLNFFEHLRNNIRVSDIVGRRVKLSKKGDEYGGLCPFHNEKTPSFTVNDAKQFYHCFGCGAHGDVIKFISETEGVSYKDASIKLAEQKGIAIPRPSKEEEKFYSELDKLQQIMELVTDFYIAQLKQNKPALQYLKSRSISNKLIADFNIGYAPYQGALTEFANSKKISLALLEKVGLIGRKNKEIYEVFRNRIMFPIRNIYGKTIAFGGRAIGDAMPKYLNSPETVLFKKNETLYGENIATSASYKKGYMVVTEGYIDVIAMHNYGFNETVACLGTAITANHFNKIWRSSNEAILCMDGDNAGLKAARKAINTSLPLIDNNKMVSFILLGAGQDPDDVLQNSGQEYMQNLLKKRLPLSEALWLIESQGVNLQRAEERAGLEKRLVEFSSQITDKIYSSNFYSFFRSKIRQASRDSFYQPKNGTANKQQLLGNNLQTPAAANLGEIERVEYSIMAFILQDPSILSKEDIFETIISIEFHDANLQQAKEHLFDELPLFEGKAGEINTSAIKDIFKNSRFSELYNVLSGSVFSKINERNEDNAQNIPMELLLKQYNLVLLKKEYNQLLSNDNEKSFSQAMGYHREMVILQNDIRKLQEQSLYDS